ncbi:hypothetical protein [Inquilinus sp. Marseille-Q2685]|uniref:hypothetical protein n=1 Tax=Inquilinus sp. Marseille-Q2685 TaxID=2866581 RepID=UPI001CE42C52|nr:hypothetical protein [Inquilinus sp. Marseille-Q2685]
MINGFGVGVFYRALREGLATTPSFGAPAPSAPLDARIGRLYGSLDAATADSAAMVAALFDGLMSTVGQWLASIVATGWRTSLNLGGDVLAVTVFDLALTPANPIPADTPIRLDLAVDGRASSAGSRMWDRRGRANTRFHHYFDQIVHLDMAGEDRPLRLTFAATIDGAPIPTLSAEVPLVFGDSLHSLQSAVLRDAAGAAVGTIRFDTRRLGPDLASQELAGSGLWTGDAAEAYANALGAAMVQPILTGLRTLAPAD